MTSPACRWAWSAAPFATTLTMSAPWSMDRLSCAANVASTLSTLTPKAARPVWLTVPVWMIWDVMDWTRFDGMAKPTPLAGVLNSGSMADRVGIPIRLPCISTSAPPLLPGLIGASVWIALGMTAPFCSFTLRPRALIMPFVTVWVMPRGLPIASTSCPTCNFEESPKVATVKPAAGGVIFSTARSSAGSVPASCADTCVPS